ATVEQTVNVSDQLERDSAQLDRKVERLNLMLARELAHEPGTKNVRDCSSPEGPQAPLVPARCEEPPAHTVAAPGEHGEVVKEVVVASSVEGRANLVTHESHEPIHHATLGAHSTRNVC